MIKEKVMRRRRKGEEKGRRRKSKEKERRRKGKRGIEGKDKVEIIEKGRKRRKEGRRK